MAFIKTIPPNQATGETKEIYNYMADVVGYDRIVKIVQIFSLRPRSMKRMIRHWELAMWMGSLPRQSRETVAVAVSRFNNCHY